MKLKAILVASGVVFFVLSLLYKPSPANQVQPLAQSSLAAATPAKIDSQPTAVSSPAPSATEPTPGDTRDFRAWLQTWSHATSTPQDLARGRVLAVARKEEMLRLFASDPAQAFAQSLSWSEWQSLPNELRGLVEKPFSAVVDFAVLPDCPPGDSSKVHPHRVLLNDEWHDAYVFGRKATMTSKEGLPARGILLDGKVVLSDQPFESLSAEDLAAISDLFPHRGTKNLSALTERTLGANAPTLLLGGELYRVSSTDEAASLNDLFAKAERSFHPRSVTLAMSTGRAGAGTIAFHVDAAEDGILRASSTWTETAKTTLAVRINYSDNPGFSYTLTEMTNLMRNASNAVKVMSYGKTWLVPRVATVTLPKTWQAYQDGGPDLIVSDTRTALSAIGINRDSYQFIVHAHPSMNFGYAGLGQIGGGICWLNGNVSLEVTVHELGHNYGLGHAHFWAGVTGAGSLGREQPSGEQVENDEYGDPFDIMGGSSLPAGQFNASGKMALNWIEQKEVINVVTNGIYRVFRFDHQGARTNAGTKLALRIAAPSGETYVVSHRRLFTSNASLYRGAHIVRQDSPNDQSLIDATPFSRAATSFSTDRTDAGLMVGRSFADPLGTMRLTTIATGGISPLEYIDVQVVFADDGAFSFFTGNDLATNGLVGTYINRSLRTRPNQDDWRAAAGVTVAGQRIDRTLSFTSDGWGARAPVRITGGTDADWENFSVQWDGVVVVREPVRLATTSDDSSRFWIDLDGNGVFGSSAPEFVNNHWGIGQGATRGDLSPIIPPGAYAFRIQYEEGNGGNYFTIGGSNIPFELFVDEAGTEPGLTGSYVARSLRTATAQVDWRTSQTISGTRVDAYPAFTDTSWGNLGEVGLSSSSNGADDDWDNFSVQWDGFLKVSVPVRMATISDDHSRMWIDVNTNGTFSPSAPEYVNNGWGGGGQGHTLGVLSQAIPPGTYRIRLQYEEGGGGNSFVLGGIPQNPPDAPSLLNNYTFSGTETRTTPRQITNDFTLQFWIRTSQVAGTEDDWRSGMGIVDASSPSAPGFGISSGNGRIIFGATDGTTAVNLRSDPIADGEWHHVSARRIQATGALTLFVDGLEAGRATGATNAMDALANLTLGSLTSGIQFFTGTIDQFKTWNTARTDEQIVADYNLARNTHGFANLPPTVHLTRMDNSVQVFWDPLSGYRTLEGAATVDGNYSVLATDQNSTNILFGPNSTRFFRVRE